MASCGHSPSGVCIPEYLPITVTTIFFQRYVAIHISVHMTHILLQLSLTVSTRAWFVTISSLKWRSPALRLRELLIVTSYRYTTAWEIKLGKRQHQQQPRHMVAALQNEEAVHLSSSRYLRLYASIKAAFISDSSFRYAQCGIAILLSLPKKYRLPGTPVNKVIDRLTYQFPCPFLNYALDPRTRNKEHSLVYKS